MVILSQRCPTVDSVPNPFLDMDSLMQPPNTRQKLAAPVVVRIAFVHVLVWRRSLGAVR